MLQRVCARKDKGFVTLPAVMVAGAVALSVAVSLIILGLGSSRSSFALEQSGKAKALADACTERGLEEIRDNPGFSGTGNFPFSQGSCLYTVTALSGENRTITATGTVGTVVRKVEVIIDRITPQINTTSWQEVEDF